MNEIVEILISENNDIVIINVSEGNSGLSAYEIAILNGFVGTESEWLSSLSGSGIIHGIAVLDFGAIPTQDGSVTITGQAGILETSNIQAFMVARSTPDNDENAHKFAAIAFRFVVSDIVAGVGFKINAYNMIGLVKGTFKIDWRWT